MIREFIGRLRKRAASAFDIGKANRRLSTVPTTTVAINSLLRTYGRTALARSRYLCQNNPYATNGRETYVAALAGDGIKPSSLLIDATQREAVHKLWLRWNKVADADGITDFYGLQGLGGRELFEAGEFFVRIRSRRPEDGLPVPMQLQLIPAEMLPFDYNIPASGTKNRIDMGIEFDAIGRRVRYHFLRNHPGETRFNFNTSNNSWLAPVDASEILHVFMPMRVGQIRGMPTPLSALVTLAMLDIYDNAELERKRTAALFAVFVRKPTVDAPDGMGDLLAKFASESPQVGLEPGAIIDLLPGEEVSFAEPADVGANYEPFQYRMLMRAAAGMGLPYASLTGDLRRANYGSIRAGIVEFRRRIQAHQNHFVIPQFCGAVRDKWMDAAVLAGTLPFGAAAYAADPEEFRACRWIPSRWDWIDPYKDRQAEKLAVDNGFKSRSDVVEEEGYDPEENDQRIAADKEREAALGISFSDQGKIDAQAAADMAAQEAAAENAQAAADANAQGADAGSQDNAN